MTVVNLNDYRPFKSALDPELDWLNEKAWDVLGAIFRCKNGAYVMITMTNPHDKRKFASDGKRHWNLDAACVDGGQEWDIEERING